jgi:hypothetical protein
VFLAGQRGAAIVRGVDHAVQRIPIEGSQWVTVLAHHPLTGEVVYSMAMPTPSADRQLMGGEVCAVGGCSHFDSLTISASVSVSFMLVLITWRGRFSWT